LAPAIPGAGPNGTVLRHLTSGGTGGVSPETDSVPSLYLVDLEGGEAWHLATPAGAPAFSPDGRKLAFAAGSVEKVRKAFLYDLETQTVEPLEGSEGVVLLSWGPSGLVAVVELADETYRFLRWTEEGWQEFFIGGSEEGS